MNRLTAYTKLDEAGVIKQKQSFAYDANGNRLELKEDNAQSGTEVQTVYSILANSNRLTSSLSGVEGTAYQYDANGNIINDGEHSYSYDSRNRLIGVDGTSSYLFNANNMRVKKTTPAGTVLYGWDNDRIYAEYDQNGNPIQETVYFGSTPVALLKGGKNYRIFADQIDTPRIITDENNQTLWAWDSKPFGESQPDEDVDGDNTQLSYNLRFPGQYYDQETGKHYNFNRDYNPVTGRYIQSDPIGLDGGMNEYIYSASSPVHNFDKDGLRKLTYGEKYLARSVFGNTINYDIVNIYKKAWAGIIPVPYNRGFTPRGNIYFNPSNTGIFQYKTNFYASSFLYRALFIHEMTHVWQHQTKGWVILKAILGAGVYDYTLRPGKRLSQFNIEQQGNITMDYFLLKWGIYSIGGTWSSQLPNYYPFSLYQSTVPWK